MIRYVLAVGLGVFLGNALAGATGHLLHFVWWHALLCVVAAASTQIYFFNLAPKMKNFRAAWLAQVGSAVVGGVLVGIGVNM